MVWRLTTFLRTRAPIPRRSKHPTTRSLELEILEDRLAPASARFAVIGDYGLAGQPEQDVANLVKSWNPEFVITTGDNNYPGGEATTIDANIGQYYHDFISPYTGSYGTGASTNRFFPSLGNHDWTSAGVATPYLDYFTLPGNERYYDFTWGPVEFFILDSDYHEPDGRSTTSKQFAWLQNELAASTAPWKLVYFHHPPYTSTTLTSLTMRWPFQAWGATAVLSGHAHVYERLVEDNNFPYFVNGLGGESKGSFGTPIAGSLVRYRDDYGAMLVNASDTQLTFQFINRAGTVIDTSMFTTSTVPTVSLAATDAAAAEPGTNTGVFTISRTGGTGNDLTVSYAVGGTATNGSDYLTLSGTAIIPAGATSTTLQVTPADDFLLEGPETVIVTLSGGPEYAVGTAGSATVTIADNEWPAAPSNLTATLVAKNKVLLTWNDNATNEQGFKIERSVDGTTFQQIATVGANVTSYQNNGVATKKTYYYRVRAYNVAGDSAYSNVAVIFTAAAAAASGLTATSLSAGTVNLTWTDNASNETGFKIERSTDGTHFQQVATVGANVTSYQNTGLASGKKYYYRVRAYNNVGDSVYSNVFIIIL